jgi:hypothetical protein
MKRHKEKICFKKGMTTNFIIKYQGRIIRNDFIINDFAIKLI